MSIEEKIKTAKEDSWLKDSVSEKEFKEIKDNERKMSIEEAIKILTNHRRFVFEDSEEDIAIVMVIQSLTAISELSKSLKAVNRYEMDEKVLIGFNMAVAIFNKYFGESGALKNEQSEQNVGMCQQNVGEMSEKQTDGDLKAEIDKLPRIKVGNSNSPTVKYCIDERLLYEILEKMKGEAEREKAEQTYGWCKGCKEYDTEKHCCHRYSSFIRETLQDSINAVLEDIKAEIDDLERFYDNDRFSTNGEPMFKVYEVLEIIDKHISGKEE